LGGVARERDIESTDERETSMEEKSRKVDEREDPTKWASMVFVRLNGLGPVLQKLGPYEDTALKFDI
jgi:hypothetical protein